MKQRKANPPLPSRTHDNAVELRANATDAESLLWYHLRSRRLAGLKFRRQHPLPPYIADFFCSEAKLVIELDGSQHGDEADALRNRILEHRGFHVLRFWNNDVLQSLGAVLDVILAAANSRSGSPSAELAASERTTPKQETP